MCECYSVIEFKLCYFLDSNFQCGHQVKKKEKFFFHKIHDLVCPIQKADWKTSTRSLSCVSVEKGKAKFTRLIHTTYIRHTQNTHTVHATHT